MVPIAEELGGIGAPRSPVSNMLIAEDLAYGDMSLAIGALSTLSFINTVIDAGTPEQHKQLLPPFTLEGFRPRRSRSWSRVCASIRSSCRPRRARTARGYVLSGEKTMVPLGSSAETMLVIADEEGVGPAAFVIEKGQAGMSCEREAFMGLRPLELCKVSSTA